MGSLAIGGQHEIDRHCLGAVHRCCDCTSSRCSSGRQPWRCTASPIQMRSRRPGHVHHGSADRMRGHWHILQACADFRRPLGHDRWARLLHEQPRRNCASANACEPGAAWGVCAMPRWQLQLQRAPPRDVLASRRCGALAIALGRPWQRCIVLPFQRNDAG